jgi:CP family cyanate transporter-like MFS transporter
VTQLYILMQCIPPLLYTILHDLEISHSAGGFLYAVPIMMIGILSFPLGIASDRIGSDRAIVLGALIVVIASFLRALTSGYVDLLIVTAVFGGGIALFFPNLSKTVHEHFPRHLIGRATGVYTAAIPLGSGLGIALTKHLLVQTGGWRHAVALWSGITLPIILVCLVLLHRLGRTFPGPGAQPRAAGPAPPGGGAQGPAQRGLYRKLLFSPLMICGVLLALLNYIFFTTIGWLPTYLVERGWDPVPAGTVTSLITFVEVPCILLVPFVAHRTGRTRSIFVANFLVIALSLLAVSLEPSLSWAAAPVLGLTFGGTFVLLLAFPAQFSAQENVGRAAGAILSIGYIGALLGPFSSGYLRDVMGSFSSAFLVVVGVSVLAAALSFTFPSRETRAPA